MKLVKIVLWAVTLLFVLVSFVLLTGVLATEMPNSRNRIIMPFSSREIINEQVLTVKMVLEDVGFTNITFKPAKNGLTMDNSVVYRVQIGDVTSFSSGEQFPTDICVIVSYK